MAKVKMLTGLARTGDPIEPGQVYECDEAEAKRLCDAGLAEPEAKAAKVKSAKESKPETAAKR